MSGPRALRPACNIPRDRLISLLRVQRFFIRVFCVRAVCVIFMELNCNEASRALEWY